MNHKIIDINCDMGEGFNNEHLILPFINSANIACGYHAGNKDIASKTIELAMKYKINIGAHPSFNDLQNFGRLEFDLPSSELFDLICVQIVFMENICKEFGTKLQHVKPHGALYNMAARNKDISATIIRAIQHCNKNYILYGLANSETEQSAKKFQHPFYAEAFADRRYLNNKQLMPRSQANAVLESVEDILVQVDNIVNHKRIKTRENFYEPIQADTICIHGDGKHAVLFAKTISDYLLKK